MGVSELEVVKKKIRSPQLKCNTRMAPLGQQDSVTAPPSASTPSLVHVHGCECVKVTQSSSPAQSQLSPRSGALHPPDQETNQAQPSLPTRHPWPFMHNCNCGWCELVLPRSGLGGFSIFKTTREE